MNKGLGFIVLVAAGVGLPLAAEGLHLVDMNLVMGDLVALAQSQATAWLTAR
jgi:hypothetical protein